VARRICLPIPRSIVVDIWFEGLSLPVSDLDRSIRF